jgi:hypothetical protein
MSDEVQALERAREAIADWFASNLVASMALPDGWFGRPYDNLHGLTWTTTRSTRLLLELDGQLLLIFTGTPMVTASADGLTISGFHQLAFIWQGYGDMTPHASVNDNGEVRLYPRGAAICEVSHLTRAST